MSADAGLAVVIGRFQPFHRGHADLLAHALATAPRVLVLLGSAHAARTPKNPFTWQERAALIDATLDAAARGRVTYVPVRDCYDDARWTAAVRRLVAERAPDARRVALVGHAKDASSYYLQRFPGWAYVECPRRHAIDATAVRAALFAGGDPAPALLRDLLPEPVCRWLAAWMRTPAHAALVEERRALDAYRAAWQAAPYPPTFVTVDAVVQAAGHVLLVRRGAHPGRGLWALPGGFLDQHERLLDGAVRELVEETRLAVPASILTAACTGVTVFDHPGRSLRGRTITHAHRFDLDVAALPAVSAADDAAQAAWVALAALPGLEDQFHEDHFHILDAVLGLGMRPVKAARPACIHSG